MRAIVLLLALFNLYKLEAQDQISLREWFTTGQAQLATAFDQSIRDKTFRPAWVERMELRTESDEFELNRQEYSLRFSPATSALRKAQSRLIKLSNQEASFYTSELTLELNKLLFEDFLILYKTKRQQQLNAELQIVLKDQEKVARRMIQDPDFNPKKLLEIEEDLYKLSIESFDNELTFNNLLTYWKMPDFSEMLSIQQIESTLASYLLNPENLPQDQKYQLDKQIIEAEMQLEKAEKNRIIDFFQLRYQGPHEDLFNERLQVGIGLELPFSGSSKTKLEQYQIEKWKLEQEAQMELQLSSIELKQEATKLKQNIRKWEFSSEALSQSLDEFKQLEKSSREGEWNSPELLLYKKAQQIERKMEILKLETEIYRLYLNFLQKVGLTRDDRYLPYLIK